MNPFKKYMNNLFIIRNLYPFKTHYSDNILMISWAEPATVEVSTRRPRQTGAGDIIRNFG